MPLPDVVFYVDTPMDVRKARIVRRGHKPRDLFYDDKSMKLEDKFYRDIKSKMRRKKDAVIVNGESKRELENIVNIVLKRINRNSRQ
jgi:thymidylate kinase